MGSAVNRRFSTFFLLSFSALWIPVGTKNHKETPKKKVVPRIILGTNHIYNDIKINDVVVYDAQWYPEPVIHRVIDINEINGSKYYTIKGDNNEVEDPYLVSPEQIRAKVITIGDNLLIIPKIGYITLWFRGL